MVTRAGKVWSGSASACRAGSEIVCCIYQMKSSDKLIECGLIRPVRLKWLVMEHIVTKTKKGGTLCLHSKEAALVKIHQTCFQAGAEKP